MVDADAEASCHRQQQRGDDHQSRAALKEHTHDEQDDVREHQERILVGGEVQNGGGDDLGEVDPGHVLSENGSGDHDQNDARSTGNGIEDDGDKVLAEGQALIDELAYNEAVQNCDSAALRRGEHAETHTQDDAEGEEQTPEGVERLLGNDLCRGELLSRGGVIALLCNDRNSDHHRQRHQDAGDITGCEGAAEGCLRDEAVDDEVNSGRNNGRGS